MKVIKAGSFDDVPVTEDVARRAVATRNSRMPRAVSISVLPARHSILIGFEDESAIALPISKYPELLSLSPKELDRLEVSFGGQAICLEERDLHLSVHGLISESKVLMGLAASMIASTNGRRVSEAKAAAARANGLKGGRPRKTERD